MWRNMMYFLLKTLITALLVAGISELGRRYSLMAAFLASLPVTSILALIWIYFENGDTQKIITLSYDIFWLVIPSLAFFLLLPWFLKINISFISSLALSCAGTALLYAVSLLLYKQWLR